MSPRNEDHRPGQEPLGPATNNSKETRASKGDKTDTGSPGQEAQERQEAMRGEACLRKEEMEWQMDSKGR